VIGVPPLRQAQGRDYNTKPANHGGLSTESFKNLLLYRGHACAEAGFIAGAGVLVDDALFHGFIDHGNGCAEGFIGRLGVAGGKGFTQLAQRCAQTGSVGTIVFRAFGGLARALQRRKMICHCDCMVPIKKSFSEGQAEDAILLGFKGLGQWLEKGRAAADYAEGQTSSPQIFADGRRFRTAGLAAN